MFFWRSTVASAFMAAPLLIRFIMLASPEYSTPAKAHFHMNDLQLFWFIFGYGLATLFAMVIPLFVRIVAERLNGYEQHAMLSEYSSLHAAGVLTMDPLGLLVQVLWIIIVGLITFAFWLFRRNISATADDQVLPVVFYGILLWLIATWPYLAYTGSTSKWLALAALELLVTIGFSVAMTALFWVQRGAAAGAPALVASVLMLIVLINNIFWWYAYSHYQQQQHDNDDGDQSTATPAFLRRGWKQLKSESKIAGLLFGSVRLPEQPLPSSSKGK